MAVVGFDTATSVKTSIDRLFNLDDKVAAIIGGSGFLGTSLAKGMDSVGMRVVVLDLVEPAYLQDLNAQGGNISYLRCNSTVKDQISKARDAILERYGKIDVLLNASGVNAPTAPLQISMEEAERIISVNLLGTLFGCQVFGEVMLRQRSGSIINFASVSSGPPLSKAYIYSAAKAGVANLTQNFAREWARYNVRVNALRPGFFPTEWSMKHFIDDQRKEDILRHTPMGRFGEPRELLGAVLWLASDMSSFTTGSIVTVDGGFTAMTI